MLIKLILLVFIVLVLFGVIKRYRKKELSAKELVLWSSLWVLVSIAIMLPQTTDLLAAKVGVGRGLDLMVVISIMALFYVNYKMVSKIERIEKDITTIVRTVAINEAHKPKDQNS
ncbi:MAG: DUF2304 domain-containing protein [Patescibacteria group bacterium]|jgi:hypothetical protein